MNKTDIEKMTSSGLHNCGILPSRMGEQVVSLDNVEKMEKNIEQMT